jgi:hypothetical protein
MSFSDLFRADPATTLILLITAWSGIYLVIYSLKTFTK